VISPSTSASDPEGAAPARARISMTTAFVHSIRAGPTSLPVNHLAQSGL